MAKTDAKPATDPVLAGKPRSPASTAGDAGYLDALARHFDQILDEGRDERRAVKQSSG